MWWLKIKLILLPLLAALALPIAVNAFWGLSEEEKTICRDRASREKNEFSAKQTYNYCSKNIKSELKREKRKAKEREKNYQRWYEEVGKDKEVECEKMKEKANKLDYDSNMYSAIASQEITRLDYVMCREELLETKRKYGL